MKIIVFAGGAGTRLWPLSRKSTPKQFSQLFGDKSTIQLTIDRLLPSFKPEDIFIATSKIYSKTVYEQLPMIPRENFIFEPSMRDVGPAIGLAVSIINKKYSNQTIGIIWSDHLVRNDGLFREILLAAEKDINNKKAKFVFIAQNPRFANQNMGWIEVDKTIEENHDYKVYGFSRLRYRPSLPEAKQFFRNENYVWNLGYFVSSTEYILQLYKEFASEMFDDLNGIVNAEASSKYEEVLEEKYNKIEKISFDDMILTKLRPQNVLVYSADLSWSDIGAWESLKEALADSRHENVTKGQVLLEDCQDSIIFNEGDKLVVGLDLEGFVVVNTNDVMLICPTTSVPKIKKLVEKLSLTEYKDLT